jgi:hypothetical protein
VLADIGHDYINDFILEITLQSMRANKLKKLLGKGSEIKGRVSILLNLYISHDSSKTRPVPCILGLRMTALENIIVMLRSIPSPT